MKALLVPVVVLLLGIGSCKQAPVEYVHSVDTLYIHDTTNHRLTGNVYGDVDLYDEFGDQLSNDAGMVVSAEGTTFSGTSDSTGRWKIEGLPAGTYNFSYNKPGFGKRIDYSVQFVGGGDAYLLQQPVYMLPSFTIPEITFSTTNASQVITPQVVGAPSNVNITAVIVVGLDSLVSLSNHVYSATQGVNTASRYIYNLSDLRHPFTSGTRVYLAVYAMSGKSSGDRNPFTNRSIYPFASTVRSNVLSAIVP